MWSLVLMSFDTVFTLGTRLVLGKAGVGGTITGVVIVMAVLLVLMARFRSAVPSSTSDSVGSRFGPRISEASATHGGVAGSAFVARHRPRAPRAPGAHPVGLGLCGRGAGAGRREERVRLLRAEQPLREGHRPRRAQAAMSSATHHHCVMTVNKAAVQRSWNRRFHLVSPSLVRLSRHRLVYRQPGRNEPPGVARSRRRAPEGRITEGERARRPP